MDSWIFAAPSTLTQNCLLQRASENYAPTGPYGPLLTALQSYLESEWQVLTLPWVEGVRGLVDAKCWNQLDILDFLRVSRQRRAKIVEDVT
jgi:hypothetical protein